MTASRIHFQAAGDLLRRYTDAISLAWRERHALDRPGRMAQEAEFLPAALSLTETPPSPAPRLAMRLIVGFSAIALIWAIFGKVDVVAVAQGRIIPGGHTKTIQPIETAAIRAIHVSDGQSVKAGDVLIELDATQTQADAEKTSVGLQAAQLQAARARALLAAIESRKAPVPAWPEGVPAARVEQEERVLAGQHAEFQAKRARMEADLVRREAELLTTREVVKKLEQTATLAKQRADDFRSLVEKNFISRHGYLDKEQARIEQEGDLATQRGRARELQAAIAQGRAELEAMVAETRRVALESLNEAEQRIAAFGQDYAKADSRNRMMTLIAPVDGTVQQLAVHTVGGVVTPAQPLMVVVPREGALEIEAFIENKDIGFVFAGQEAQVKLETFPFTRYGTVPATVTHVSSDAISDEKRGLIYSAKVQMSRTVIEVDGKTVNLSPGMTASVEIKTGRRRIIDFFLSPLAQYGGEALRER